MSQELVLLAREGACALVTLNNPKTRNAMSRDLLLRLADVLEDVRTDNTVRAVVIQGADGHFCSGGDVSGMSAPRPLPLGRERMVVAHRVVKLVTGMGKPVVAAVEGYAAGAGFSLAVACDVVVASTAAKFVSSFAKVSLIPDLGLMWSLPQRVGLAQAKRLLLSARVLPADEALRIGVADELAEPGTSTACALAVAAEMSAHAPISAALVKAAYARGMNTLDDALNFEMDNQAALYLTQDHREAVAAFMEKRPPVFQGI